jgi:uncharacterized protein YehS (DUF1456 family)
MTNNDILRRLRYTFDLNDNQVIETFALAGLEVSRAEMSDWLKKDDDPDYKSIYDPQLAVFLTGFIIYKRGKKGGEEPKSEKKLNNNIVFRKLKIALSLKDEDIIEILELVDFRMGKHELSAFFRNPTQNQYRPCKDQVLRNFIHGLQVRYQPKDISTPTPKTSSLP